MRRLVHYTACSSPRPTVTRNGKSPAMSKETSHEIMVLLHLLIDLSHPKAVASEHAVSYAPRRRSSDKASTFSQLDEVKPESGS